jgi:putative ABC transport system permease protein
MFKNFPIAIGFKTAWRNLINRKFYSGINILGLSLGIACALFLYLFISYQFSFDRYHKNASATYRIVNEIYFDKTVYVKDASMGMYDALAAGVSKINYATIMLKNYTFTVAIKNKNNIESRFKEDKNIALVAPSWFKIFDYKFLAGNANDLAYPNTAVIMQKQANKYFGNENPIGRTIIFPNNVPVKIVGLISDKPFNSDLKSDLYVSLSSLKNIYPGIQDNFFTDWSWINTNTSVFLTLNNNRSREAVETEINNMAKAHLGNNAKYYHFILQPLADVHFDSNYGGPIQKSLLYTLMITGICILIIASVNYVNLSIAQQARRMVEIGTRKVLGATPWKLFIQFIIETFCTVIIAILISVVAVAAILPAANESIFASDPIYIISYKNVIGFLCVLLFALIILAGFYPAVILSRIAVFKAFKNATGSWKAGITRKILVVVQNSVAYILIICTIVMLMQVQFLKHTQIGFNSNTVVMLPFPDSSSVKKDFFKTRLNEMPQIASYSFCHSAPSSRNDWGGSIKFNTRPDWESWVGLSEVGDSSYVKTFGLDIIAGRNISVSAANSEFLINEKMVSKLGLKNPGDVLDKSLTVGEFGDKQGTVVGVVKDFNTQSLMVPIEPVVIADVPEKFDAIGIKLNGNDLQSSIAAIKAKWEAVYPDQAFEYHFVDDQIASLYMKQDLQQKIIWIAAMIAIIISCLGLLGLVSLVILQRTKEIGIRKVLGASVPGIVQLISKDFLQLVIIAIVIATPLAWLLMNKWLQNFAYHINISWWVFVMAALFAIFIAVITISFQSIKAAMANPVESLRTE